MSESRPPDDTPTRLQQIQRRFEASYYVDNSAESAVEDLLAEVSRIREEADKLKRVQTLFINNDTRSEHEWNLAERCEKLEAEVSRLREEMAPLYNTEQWLKWCDIRVLERAEAAEADVSRLQQENALLKRSLSMLTKQLEQKEAEWEAQRDDERYRDRTSDHE